jgi:hypothetical protein
LAWDYKLGTLLLSSIALDTQNKRIRLGSKEYDYGDIRGAEFYPRTPRILIKTNDPRRPTYSVNFVYAFPFFSFEAWRARLESELDLSPTFRVKD